MTNPNEPSPDDIKELIAACKYALKAIAENGELSAGMVMAHKKLFRALENVGAL